MRRLNTQFSAISLLNSGMHRPDQFSLNSICAIKSTISLEMTCPQQGHSWGVRGPGAGCNSGPCWKLFNLYVRSIYLFVLLTIFKLSL